METELTKTIKRQIPFWRPAMKGNMRTIRYAYEVWTPTGIVDCIRFEDYIAGIEPLYQCRTPICFRTQKDSKMVFNEKSCVGCVNKVQNPGHKIAILFSCFEIKISVSDFKSKNGHNFHGNKNYYVVPNSIVEKVLPLVPDGIGLIAFYPKTNRFIEKRPCEFKEMGADSREILLYNALKKWMKCGALYQRDDLNL